MHTKGYEVQPEGNAGAGRRNRMRLYMHMTDTEMNISFIINTMRKTGMTLAAVLLAAALIRPHAEETIGTAGIEFDFNQDGITDSTDWSDLKTSVSDFRVLRKQEERRIWNRCIRCAGILSSLTRSYHDRKRPESVRDMLGVRIDGHTRKQSSAAAQREERNHRP